MPRPLPKRIKERELRREDDTPERSALRGRAERLLLCQAERIREEHPELGPVILALLEQEDHQQVSVTQAMDEQGQELHVVLAGPEWIEGSTDEELLATFSHELGHVVLGHCREKDRGATRVLLGSLVMGACLGAASLGAVILRLDDRLIDWLAWGGLSLMVPVILTLWRCSWQDRKQEYAADQFVKRFACPGAFIDDLAKGYVKEAFSNRFYCFMARVESLAGTHPCLEDRARALDVPFPVRP